MILPSLFWARFRHGRFDRALGASGPGIDLSLYLARRFFGFRIVQLVHGPVARSRTIGRALASADRVFYLESAADSLLQALDTLQLPNRRDQALAPGKFVCFSNGLCEDQWPSSSQRQGDGIFWAASLLRWKGLETLIRSLKLLTPETRPQTHICYIKPRGTQLALGPGPTELERVNWYENPSNLDQIRASCKIFVSTSRNEPFGLSILEAMAAGLAVVIPRDNAYWDRHLEDREHCLKYRPEDPQDLALKILYLQQNPELVERLGRQARLLAGHYRADRVYREFVHCLESAEMDLATVTSDMQRKLDHAEV